MLLALPFFLADDNQLGPDGLLPAEVRLILFHMKPSQRHLFTRL